MMTVGWLLDAYIDEAGAVMWFRLKDGAPLKLVDTYTPAFYVKPKKGVQLEGLGALLSQHPNVLRVEPEKRFASLEMKGKLGVLHVWVDTVENYWRVVKGSKKLGLIQAFYNLTRRGDLLHVQKYLFHRGYVPTSKVEIEYSEKGRLLSLRLLDDECDVQPPPFTALPFKVEARHGGHTLKPSWVPISRIVVFDDNLEVETVLEGEEGEVLSMFQDRILEEDPDFLVAPRVKESVDYILERAGALELKPQLGREPIASEDNRRSLSHGHRGRVLLNLSTYQGVGIAGLVERARFTMTPPGLSAEWQAGHIIDSRQGYEALKRGVLLSEKGGFYSYGMTAREIAFRDRGGLLLAPEAGLHENVGELDFESMFPNVIEEFNVSYETVTPEAVDTSVKGFLGELTKRFLVRRLYFKHLRREYPRGSREWMWSEQRQTALKGILVCIYGFSGCFANRFGNVAVYQEINRIARRVLLQAVNVALKDGFKVVYGDTDSLFLKRGKAARGDYEKLAEKISLETGLPMALDHHYKFLVFLNQKSRPEMDATRRYFGKLTNGELYYRGIELRRRDSPSFLKGFQERLMEILFDADSARDVETRQLRKARAFVAETCRRIRRGEIDPAGLSITKVLRKPLDGYHSLFPHVAAAKHLEWRGRQIRGGEAVDFLYVNARHRNPYRRVVPLPVQGRKYYNGERYVELALDVAETVLGVFGFHKRGKESNLKITEWR